MGWDGGYGLKMRRWPGMEAMAWDGGYGLETCVRLGVDHIHYLRIQCFT